MNVKHINFDSELNALDNLEKACMFLDSVSTNPQDWKWVTTSLHSAMYGYAINVAKGTDDKSVVNATKRGDRLIPFHEALKICRMPIGPRAALSISFGEQESLKFLQNEFRNRFEHFTPGHWSIEISGFPNHVLNQLNVVRRLALEINFYTHLSIADMQKTERVFDKCEDLLTNLALNYDTDHLYGVNV